jgi:hypothetical protein
VARYFRRGRSKIKWAPSVAGSSPTRPEITAGVDLSPSVADIGGFQLNNNPIETPDLSTGFNSQIDGPDTTDDSSLTFYDDDTATTIRTTLAKGVSGYVLLMPYGDVTAKRCEVWNSKSTGVNDQWTLDATAAQFRVGFAVLTVPNQAGVIP